jgi:hypothetical protein
MGYIKWTYWLPYKLCTCGDRRKKGVYLQTMGTQQELWKMNGKYSKTIFHMENGKRHPNRKGIVIKQQMAQHFQN